MKKLNEFDGIEVNSIGTTLSLISNALELTKVISKSVQSKRSGHMSAALNSSLLTTNSLIDTSAAKCTLVAPAEDIDLQLDSSGDLVLRCYHSPSHKWDLSGNRK